MRRHVCSWQILLKKSFLADERNFSAPLVRPARGDVRDHIDSYKSDRRSSYLSYSGLQRRKQRNTDLREIFGAAQFSTFSTVSVKNGPDGPETPFPVYPEERTSSEPVGMSQSQ